MGNYTSPDEFFARQEAQSQAAPAQSSPSGTGGGQQSTGGTGSYSGGYSSPDSFFARKEASGKQGSTAGSKETIKISADYGDRGRRVTSKADKYRYTAETANDRHKDYYLQMAKDEDTRTEPVSWSNFSRKLDLWGQDLDQMGSDYDSMRSGFEAAGTSSGLRDLGDYASSAQERSSRSREQAEQLRQFLEENRDEAIGMLGEDGYQELISSLNSGYVGARDLDAAVQELYEAGSDLRYQQRQKDQQQANRTFWSSLAGLIGTGAALSNSALPADQRARLMEEQEQYAASMKAARSAGKAAAEADDWDGREALIEEYKDLQLKINTAERRLERGGPGDAAALARDRARLEEIRTELEAGDRTAGNGPREYSFTDRADSIVGGTAKNLAYSLANTGVTAWDFMQKAGAYNYSEAEMRRDAITGRDSLQEGIDAYNSEEAQARREAMYAAVDQIGSSAQSDLERAKNGLGVLGQAGVDIAENVIEMGFDAAVGAMTGGSSLTSMFVRVFGQGAAEARQAGATLDQQILYGAATGGIEVLTEKLADGVAGIYGKGAADDITEALVRRLSGSQTGQTLLRALIGATNEGLEEVLSDLLNPLAQMLYRDDSLGELYRELDPAEILYDYLIGAAIGGLGSVTNIVTGGNSEANAENNLWSATYENMGERPSMRQELRDRGIMARLEAEPGTYDAANMTPGQQAAETMQALRGSTPDSVRAQQLSEASDRAALQEAVREISGQTGRESGNVDNSAEARERYSKTVPEQYASVKVDGENGRVEGMRYVDGKAVVQLRMEDNSTRTMDVDSVRALVPTETGDLLYKTAGLGKDAPAVFAAYSKTQSIEDYTTGMDVAINMLAANGASRESMTKSSLTKALSDAQLDIAYEIGHKKFLTAGQNGGAAAGTGSGGVYFNGNSRGIEGLRAASDQDVRREAQKVWGKAYQDNIRLASVVSKATGLNVVFFDSMQDNGKLGSRQGMYAQDGTVYVDIRAGQDTEGFGEAVIVRTLSHELTHFLEKNAPQEYKALRKFVVDHIAELGDGSFEELVTQKMKQSKASSTRGEGGDVLNYQEAVNEVVADACEMMLTRSEMVQKLAYEHFTTAQKMWDHIRRMFRKMRESVAPKSREAILLKNQYDAMSVMWDRALEQAVKNREAAQAEASSKQAEASTEAAKEKSAPASEADNRQYSLRQFEDGRKYVDVETDQEQFNGLTPDEQAALARRIILKKFSGKVIGVNNAVFVNRSGAEEYAYPAKFITDPDVKSAKMRASTELDNLVEAGTNFRTEPDGRDGHVHPDAVGGFSYFDTLFKVGKDYYEGTVNVLNNKRGKLFKDVTKIRNVTKDIMASYGANPRNQFLSDISMFSVPQGGAESKTDFQSSLRDATGSDTKEETAERVRSYNQLRADNAALQRQVERLRKELKRTKENTVRGSDAKKLARELLGDLRTDVSADELAQVIERMGNYLVSASTEELDYEVLRDWAGEIAHDIVRTAEEPVETGMEDVAKVLKDYLHGQRLQISADNVHDLGVESLTAWKKNNPGIRVSTTNGIAVDVAYQELQGQLGEGLLPSSVTHPADQLNLISDLLQDSTREETRNPFAGYQGEAIEHFTEDIINMAMGETLRQTAPTFADKAASQLAKAKAEGKQAVRDQREKDRQRLDDMRAKNRQRISDIRQNTQARIDEIRAKERAEKWKKVDSLRRYYQAKERSAAARRRESGKSTELRHKIRKLHADLTRRLTRPSENKYVPATLTKAVANLLESINLDSGRSQRMSEAFQELNRQYHKLAENARTSDMIDPVVEDMLKKMGDRITELRGASIYSMSSEDLRMIYETMKAVDHTTRNAVRLINYETEKDAFEIARGMIEETRAAKKLPLLAKKWLFASMRPETFFKRMAGYAKNSNWEMIADMLDQAQLKQTQLQMEGAAFFEELMKDTKSFDAMTDIKHLIDIGLKDEDGNSILITRGFAVKVYLDTLNEENSRHLMYGAYSMPDMKQYYKSSSADAYNNGTRVRGYGVQLSELRHAYEIAETEEERQEIEGRMKVVEQEAQSWVDTLRASAYSMMGEYERKWVAAWQAFAEFSQKKLNETSMAVYGFEKATVENYVPIHTDPNFRAAQFDAITKDMSLENAGFMKARVPNASQPMLGEDIVDIASRQIDNVAKYAAMMPGVKNFNRVYSKGMAGFSDSVQNAVSRTFGADASKYIQNLMTDLTNPRRTEGGLLGQFADMLRGNLARASLTLNPRVALGQAASYPTAAAVVGWGPLMKAFGEGPNAVRNEQARAEIAKRSPLMWYRMQGFFDREVGDMRKDRGLVARISNKLSFMTNWIEFMDGATVGRLWYAAQIYVQEHNPDLEKGSDAFLDKSAEVFNRIVERTQPNYTTFQRPDILRNPNAIVRQLTTFMTQRLQNANILFDAVGTYQAARHDFKSGRKHGTTEADLKAAREGLVNAVSSQLAAAATITVFKALADALMYNMKRYRDDDDELTKESFFDTLFNNFFESLASNFLAGSEIYSFIRAALTDESYHGISLTGVELFTDALSQLNKTIKDPNSKNFETLAMDAAQVFGVPMPNVAKIVNAIRLRVKDAREGNGLGSFASEIEKTDSIRARDLYKAMAAGDKERINELTEYFGGQSGAMSRVASYIKSQLKAGKMNEAEAIDNLQQYARYNKDDAYWAVKKVLGGDDFDKFEDIDSAVSAGDQDAFDRAADFLHEHGVEDDDIRKHMNSTIHDWYITGEEGRPRISKERAVDLLNSYGNVKSKWEAENQVREWTLEIVRGFKYSDIQQQYVDGNITQSDAVNLLVMYGPDAEVIASRRDKVKQAATDKVLGWQCEKDTGIRYGEIQSAYIFGDIDKAKATSMLVKYGKVSQEEAEEKVLGWDAVRDHGIVLSSTTDGVKSAYLHEKIDYETGKSIMMLYDGQDEDHAEAYMSQYDFAKVTGYDWSDGKGIQDAIRSGKYSDDELIDWWRRCDLDIHGSTEKAATRVEVAHWKAEVPGTEIFDVPGLNKWNKNSHAVYAAGLDKEDFARAYGAYKGSKADYDSDTGDQVEGSKARKVFAIIDTMQITPAQKNALAQIFYKPKTVRTYAPW